NSFRSWRPRVEIRQRNYRCGWWFMKRIPALVVVFLLIITPLLATGFIGVFGAPTDPLPKEVMQGDKGGENGGGTPSPRSRPTSVRIPIVGISITLRLTALFPPWVIGSIIVAIGLAVLAVAMRTRSRDAVEMEGETSISKQVGQEAGRAASRIRAEPDAAENAVFEAWSRMVAPLDGLDHETSTPREFEIAAINAGVDSGDAEELTRLFEDVRYGGVSVSEDLANRAIETLERIEEKYAEVEDSEQQSLEVNDG
ncbi:MAG: DUF4129 domain-containing protein, partial [Halobacteriaceae archaeon]